MTELVDPKKIEKIFGVPRHEDYHLLLFKAGTIYIMHSHECVNTGIDLRKCAYSVALDKGELNWEVAEGLLIGRL